MNMGKRILCFVCALICAVMSLSAQKFFEITDLKAQPNGTEFEVVAGAQRLRVNPIVFGRVEKNPAAYFLAIYVGEKTSKITVVRKADVQYIVTEVVSVEKKNNKWAVKLASGEFDVYTSSNPEWETVQPGQHVSYCTFVGETKALAVKPHTVGRDVELTDKVPVSPSPEVPIILLDKENKIIGVNL